ncbi:MAG: sensor histidine kinase, partial [Anaerolineae bacterium]
SGIGIAPEDQEKIFQEFYRTEEAKQIAPHGTGLGLSIVKQIVEGLGGRIWVSSAPGKGAKFTFVLPRSDVPAPAGPAYRSVQAPASPWACWSWSGAACASGWQCSPARATE